MMQNKEPPFEITNKMLSEIIEIGNLVDRVSWAGRISANPVLRRANRILSRFAADGRLEKLRVGSHWGNRKI